MYGDTFSVAAAPTTTALRALEYAVDGFVALMAHTASVNYVYAKLTAAEVDGVRVWECDGVPEWEGDRVPVCECDGVPVCEGDGVPV